MQDLLSMNNTSSSTTTAEETTQVSWSISTADKTRDITETPRESSSHVSEQEFKKIDQISGSKVLKLFRTIAIFSRRLLSGSLRVEWITAHLCFLNPDAWLVSLYTSPCTCTYTVSRPHLRFDSSGQVQMYRRTQRMCRRRTVIRPSAGTRGGDRTGGWGQRVWRDRRGWDTGEREREVR